MKYSFCHSPLYFEDIHWRAKQIKHLKNLTTMIINKTSLRLLVFFGTIGISACNRNPCEPTRNYPMKSQAMVHASTFKAGSFFVYRDSITGIIDSFYTTDGNKVELLYSYERDKCGNPYSSHENNNCIFKSNSGETIKTNGGDGAVFCQFNIVQISNIYSTYYADTTSSISKGILFLPTCTINGHTYQDIQVYYDSNIVSYFNADVGLLKFVKKDGLTNKVFELNNYLSLK